MTSQSKLFPVAALLALALISALATAPTVAGEAESVEVLLAAGEPPAGVVFDVSTGDDDALVGLLPRLKADIERLRARYPDLPVAIVTHGTEQFALTRDCIPLPRNWSPTGVWTYMSAARMPAGSTCYPRTSRTTLTWPPPARRRSMTTAHWITSSLCCREPADKTFRHPRAIRT